MSTTDSEEWRPVVGWERGYSISSLGRVRRDLASPKTRVGRILTPSWGGGRGKGQYKCVRLSIDNVARTCRIASMVDVGAGKQLTQFPTRAELIAETAKRRKKRDDAIALMRRRPRDSHEGEMR